MEKLFSLVPHLCFQGHTHVPGVFTTATCDSSGQSTRVPAMTSAIVAQRLMINVGSVGQPRDGDPRSCYVVFDEDMRRIPPS